MSQALTQALDAIDRYEREDHEAPSPILVAQARAILTGYDARWQAEGWETVTVEEEFLLPVVNPDTEEVSDVWQHAGKFDGVIQKAGHPYLLEHKTAAEEIEDPHAPYWRRLAIDAQISAYVLASWQDGLKLEGTVYDVLRKPTIRPRKLTKKELAALHDKAEYFGLPVAFETWEAVKEGRIDSEDAHLYELRLTREYLDEGARFFQRRTIARLDRDVLEFARELWQTQEEIRYTREHDAHYRNSGACMQWGRPCPFLGICSGHDTPESGRWARKEYLHSELPRVSEAVGSSRNVLTYSRMQTYKLCKRKHYYAYELGIQRPDEEAAEALRFGSLVHAGLEAWWLAFKTPEEATHAA